MYYPHSLLKYILLGFFLVCLPLVVALFEQNDALNNLAEQSSKSVFESSNIAQLSQQLYEQAATLERLALQYTIVEDAAQIKVYESGRQHFLDLWGRLRARFIGDVPDSLQVLSREETRLWGLLKVFPAGQEVESKTRQKNAIIEGFRRFVDKAHVMQGETAQVARDSVEILQQTADESREQWWLLLRVSLGIALAMALVMALMISRPIKALDREIRRLGSGDFSREIEVRGPKDLRLLGERLEWLRSRLRTLEDQQNRFLRNVSHDLKTPLTAIREGTELLRDGVGGALRHEQNEIVMIVHENALSLQKMIEDLLNYQQARAMAPDKLLPVDMEKLIREVAEEHRLVALRRLIIFDLKLNPAMVSGDKKKVATIIDNLISNAIKFSPRLGKITVLLRVRGAYARIDVLDEGSGVPEDERERIFDTFFQGDAPKPEEAGSGQRVKGSGLGLAVAREYTKAHGGKIKASERPDGRQGARLSVWLPVWKPGLVRRMPSPETSKKSREEV